MGYLTKDASGDQVLEDAILTVRRGVSVSASRRSANRLAERVPLT